MLQAGEFVALCELTPSCGGYSSGEENLSGYPLQKQPSLPQRTVRITQSGERVVPLHR